MRKKVENNFAVLFASPPSTLAVQSAGQVLLTLSCKEEREGEGGKMMALASPSCRGWGGGGGGREGEAGAAHTKVQSGGERGGEGGNKGH